MGGCIVDHRHYDFMGVAETARNLLVNSYIHLFSMTWCCPCGTRFWDKVLCF